MEADSIVTRARDGVACLVREQVDRSDSQEAASTLRPGNVDGVAYAPVAQPAGIAHVHAALPGQIKFSGGGKSGTQFTALILSFVESELLY